MRHSCRLVWWRRGQPSYLHHFFILQLFSSLPYQFLISNILSLIPWYSILPPFCYLAHWCSFAIFDWYIAFCWSKWMGLTTRPSGLSGIRFTWWLPAQGFYPLHKQLPSQKKEKKKEWVSKLGPLFHFYIWINLNIEDFL